MDVWTHPVAVNLRQAAEPVLAAAEAALAAARSGAAGAGESLRRDAASSARPLDALPAQLLAAILEIDAIEAPGSTAGECGQNDAGWNHPRSSRS